MRNFSILAAIAVGCFLGTVVSNVIIHPQTAIAETSGNPSVITANRIELVDMNGKKRVSLELEDNDKFATLNMWDADEKLLLSLKASQDSSGLVMKENDKAICGLGIEKVHGSFFSLFGPKNEPGVVMSAGEHGGAMIIHGKEGKAKAFGAD